MDFEEAGARLKLAVGLSVLGYGGWWLIQSRMQASLEREVAEPRESGREAAARGAELARQRPDSVTIRTLRGTASPFILPEP